MTNLAYYQKELAYLRQEGKRFASQHPKIAARLDFSGTDSADPHTQRLLESFAFLTAKLHEEIDRRLPQLASGLLQALYPHLSAPVPSFTITQFQSAPGKGRGGASYTIPSHTPLVTYADEQTPCHFQTVFPVTVWPIHVSAAEVVITQEQADDFPGEATAYLRLELKTLTGTFADLSIDSLTFCLHGDRLTKFALYEGIMTQDHPELLINGVRASGVRFCEPAFEHMMRPLDDRMPLAHQILQDYIHFPDKFLFITLDNLPSLTGGESGGRAELLISLWEGHGLHNLSVTADHVRLGCTPVVNLFQQNTEPLRLDHTALTYPLIADRRREATTEIYAIQEVMAVEDATSVSQRLTPYFSVMHSQDVPHTSPTYWLAKRARSTREGVPGTDIVLSFVDLAFNPHMPATKTVYAQVWCTNRQACLGLRAGALFQVKDRSPISKIVALDTPTRPLDSPEDGETLWRLVAQLSVEHLSVGMTSPTRALELIQETLVLHSRGTAHHDGQHIKRMTVRSVVRRMGDQAWRGFCQGLAVDLSITSFTGGSRLLLARVLHEVLAAQAGVNTFVELHVYDENGEQPWKSWPPKMPRLFLNDLPQ